jgi:hypothetical protein
MTPLQQLKEDYERRAKTASQMIHDRNDTSGTVRHERLQTKASLYREFAYELGKLRTEEELQEKSTKRTHIPFGADIIGDFHAGPMYNAAGKQINDLDL